MDWLAEKVFDALEANGHMSASWIKGKREDYASASRLQVLQWVCLSLDSYNIEIAARAIGVSTDDLKATGRVLQKI